MLGKMEGKRKRGWQRMRWLDSVINTMNMILGGKLQVTVEDRCLGEMKDRFLCLTNGTVGVIILNPGNNQEARKKNEKEGRKERREGGREGGMEERRKMKRKGRRK
ncbi:Neurogenic locus notch-like protein 1, partial [Ophiophagus hannah]